jgi:DNA-binding beta-propeller fold protein YncE
MNRFLVVSILVTVVFFACITACVHQPQTAPNPIVASDGNYPSAVAKIVLNKCATAGCHNAASYQNADGLLLDTWEHLLQGSVSGAEVVAYSPQYSPLLYYVNTDSSLGTVATDPGHLTTPISREEYLTLSNWVAAGAPDKNGNIPFASEPSTRQKIYLTNQGCDLLAVIDGKSKLVMRYIKIGADDAKTESPHDVEVSADGMYAYVVFYNGSYVQKINTATDQVIAGVNLAGEAVGGTGQWSVIGLSPGDTSLMVSGYMANGYAVTINTSTMQVNPALSVDINSGGTDKLVYPHGLAANPAFDTFYATLQSGNVVNKFTFKPVFSYKYISIDGGPSITTHNATTPDPHQVEMSPDYSRYFVTCQNTNEVRVLDRKTDALINTIPVGAFPQEMAVSESRNYLYVACMEDAANPQPGRRGSVYVIDMGTLQVVKILYGDFYQPHDIAVDEQDGLVYIPSRNANPSGPAPHHATACNGRAGWYSVYDLNTMEPVDSKRYDVTVDPYAIAPRF